ncbi:phosphate/phosphite/phosphonate ABC transporter substrate-binding protein [Primorskyibacter sp. 2E107]
MLWSVVRATLGYGPERLDRTIELWDGWQHPDLVLGQTCNLPYRMSLKGKVQIVGHPDFALPRCPRGYYNSVLVARQTDPRSLEELLHCRVVYNQDHSHSGCLALWDHAQTLGIEPNFIAESGAHVASAAMISNGEADLAAIDAHSWRLIRRYDAHSAGLREITRTIPTPAPPFICSAHHDVDGVRAALRKAIDSLPQVQRATLNLHGLIELPQDLMLNMPTPPQVPAMPISATA